MMDSTFVTLGKAIASAQVTVTKAAVKIKFLKFQIEKGKLTPFNYSSVASELE